MSKDRHSLLIAAGWAYDPKTDMYHLASEDPDLAKRYNLAAAWDAHARAAAPTQPKISDPRRSKPI